MIDDIYYTPEEISQRFKLSLSTIYNLIDKGELPSIKLGKSYRIPHSELSEFLRSRTRRSTVKAKINLPKSVSRYLDLIEASGEKDNVTSIILFGSYARGDYDSESDIDLLVIVKDLDLKTSDRISEFSDEAMLHTDYEEFLSIIQLSDMQWMKAKDENTPFYKSVSKEGIELWKK